MHASIRKDQRERKRRLMAYAKGWMTAAGCQFIPSEFEHNEDFKQGWIDGQQEKQLAMERAEKMYRSKFAKMTLAGEDN